MSRKEEKPYVMRTPTDILRSNDAVDVEWWFQRAARELGFTSKSFIEGGGGGYGSGCTLKPTHQILAVAKERRIHSALQQLPARYYQALALAYSCPGHLASKDVGAVLGKYPGLAATHAFIQTGYVGYQQRFRPMHGKNGACPISLELWVLKNVVKARSDIAKKIRDWAEDQLREALERYREVRRPKPRQEAKQEREEADRARPTRAPRRSVASDFAPEGWGR